MSGPDVVFILSTNYAGSHLLAQLLGAHDRCAGVGELHNYRKFRDRGSRSGNVENDYLAHPAFADLEALPVAEWHGRILERLRQQRPGLTHLVDNSKRPEWLRRLPAVSAHPVHLLRDPRALVSRWLRTYETSAAVRGQRRRLWRQRPWLVLRRTDAIAIFAEKWLVANQRISRFLASRPAAALVTYRDLACAPAPTLAELMPALGLDYQPAQLDYGRTGDALGTRKRDYLSASRDSRIELDLRWREHLSASDQRRIENHRGINRYLQDLALTLGDDGLSAAPQTGPSTAAG